MALFLLTIVNLVVSGLSFRTCRTCHDLVAFEMTKYQKARACGLPVPVGLQFRLLGPSQSCVRTQRNTRNYCTQSSGNVASTPSAAGPADSQSNKSSATRVLRRLLHWDIVNTMFGTLLSKLITDEDILSITTKSISSLIWFAIILGALGTAGFDTKPILSIFGVAGITLGLSLQNLFSDLYAGLFVLFTRPFKRGSVVTISGHTGRVVSMDMRYVRLHNDTDASDVLLPISLVYRNAVKVIEGNGKHH